MNEILVILSFGGYVALLLWGVHMVQTGVQRAFGKALGLWMGRALGGRARAFFTGMGITAAIQSSTATGLMITGFAAGGAVALVPGLAAMLGANVGTTLIVQVLSFNLDALAPTLILLGVWMFRRNAPSRARDLGRTFIGLGLLLLSLHELVSIFEPIQQAQLLEAALESLDKAPVFALILSALFAWASHSSVSVVVLIMSLAHHGLVSPSLAYALVLGANLGTAINPVLEGVTDQDPASRRLPIGNLGTRVVGCMLGLAALPWIPAAMNLMTDDPARAVANFHTLLNILIALGFLPVLEPYARLLTRLLPKQTDPNDPARPMYLDDSAREVPAVALGNAAREALRLTDLLQGMLQNAQRALLHEDTRVMAQARYLNDAINRLDQAITAHLATLDQETLSGDDQQRLDEILTFSSNIANAASMTHMGLLGHANQLHKKNWILDTEQRTQLQTVLTRLIRNLRQTAAMFVSEDRHTARDLAYEKDHFRGLEAQATERHLGKIKAGELDSADIGTFYLEILRDATSVNSYLVNAAAYPILAKHGELLPNRLRESRS